MSGKLPAAQLPLAHEQAMLIDCTRPFIGHEQAVSRTYLTLRTH